MSYNTPINGPIDCPQAVRVMVWYAGSTALAEGSGMCYNWDYGTATTAEASRYARVEVPTTSNNMYFAGVCAAAYAAKSTNSPGQFIEIYPPGSICKVLCAASTVIGVGRLTCDVTTGTAGLFNRVGMYGRGSAVPLQTTTYVATSQLVLCRLEDGRESGLQEAFLAVDNDACVIMVGGTSWNIAATALGAGDTTFTLADAAAGQDIRKAIAFAATLGTNNLVVTVTSGVLWAGTALSTITADTDLMECELEWTGLDTNGSWHIRSNVGPTLA